MKSFKERIKVNNNQDECKERATHKHSNGDLYVKASEPHEFGEWLNFNHSNGFWTKSLLEAGNESILTLIKKPTPTKFVKVEESIFDLKGEFERGELYCKNLCASDDYTRLNTEVALFGCAAAGNIYRQVEIDWRDEVKKLDKSAIFHDGGDLFLIIDSDSDDFISMCHEIASLTEKPTN